MGTDFLDESAPPLAQEFPTLGAPLHVNVSWVGGD